MNKNNCMKNEYPYPDFRGMDVTGDEGFDSLMNMYIDPTSLDGSLESVVGYRKKRNMSEGIQSISALDDSLLIHSGKWLYHLPKDGLPKRIATLDGEDSIFISLGNKCLVSDGKRMLAIDGDTSITTISEDRVIAGCRCATVHNGRLLLSGNPEFKGRLYCSEASDDDNISFTEVVELKAYGKEICSIISLDGFLWVFWRSDDDRGGVICLKKTDDGYSTVREIDLTAPLSEAILLGREMLFLTESGLMGIEATTDGSIAKLNRHSTVINKRLIERQEKLYRLNLWMGYIVIRLDKIIYLISPRDNGGYNCFPLIGVGGYKGDRRVFRYKSEADDGCVAHYRVGDRARGEIYSKVNESSKMIYYSMEDDVPYSVYPTPELSGGEFMPLKGLCSDGRLMWFYTDDGSLYLFNNDKRGAMPDEIPFYDALNFDIGELGENRIHPLYYSFAGHTPCYALLTKETRCRKNSSDEKTNILIGIKRLGGKEIRLMEIADGEVISERALSCKNAKNSRKSLIRSNDFVTVSLNEHVKKAKTKQLCLMVNGFASPFGLAYISYDTKKKG